MTHAHSLLQSTFEFNSIRKSPAHVCCAHTQDASSTRSKRTCFGMAFDTEMNMMEYPHFGVVSEGKATRNAMPDLNLQFLVRTEIITMQWNSDLHRPA